MPLPGSPRMPVPWLPCRKTWVSMSESYGARQSPVVCRLIQRVNIILSIEIDVSRFATANIDADIVVPTGPYYRRRFEIQIKTRKHRFQGLFLEFSSFALPENTGVAHYEIK